MRTSMFFILLASVAFAPTARAQNCAEPSSQKEMTDCAKQDYDKSDAALNVNYTLIKERLEGDTKTTNLLVSAQRAWLAFRDTECTFAASGVEGGSFYNFTHLQCLTRLTESRVRQLDTYLKCQEGDLTCPVPN